MKTFAILLAVAVVIAPAAAPAQLGGLGKKLLGRSGGSGIATGDAEAFLSNATRSTKNVMISAALLAHAVTEGTDLAGRKAQINALQNAQSIKEVDAHSATLKSDLAVLSSRSDLAADLSAVYEAGTAEQKKMIAIAVANLAIGIYRNTELAGQAPDMVKGIGSNPQLITRAGQFKLAAGLLGLQAKGLGGIATAMPKLLSAVKVQTPDAAGTTEPQPVAL